MMSLRFILYFTITASLFAQSGIDVTGRISLRTMNTDYNEKSKLKQDSIPADQYSKTTLIPGLQQSLNLALFARTSSLDITLLGDLKNDDWNRLNSFERINRLSLNARFGGNHELIVGDFFETGSEFYIQSREIRGGKLHLVFDNLWNNHSYLETDITGGRIERAFAIGDRLQDLYRQYETSGQYRRYFASGGFQLGDRDLFSIGMNYLYATDDSSSITGSINEPLANQNAGVNGALLFWNRRIRIFSEGFLSKKDTLTAKSVDDYAWKGGMDLRIKYFKLIAFYYRIGYDYYTAGYPFLNNDRQGFEMNGAYQFPGIVIISAEAEQYDDNLENNSFLPVTTTRLAYAGFTTNFRGLPEVTLKLGFRDDNSATITDNYENTIRTEKLSLTYEGRIAYNFGSNRLSASAMYIDLDDKSLLAAGTPLGTEQFISSLNFYSRPAKSFFISGGGVYSRLLMTNAQDNKNIYLYESSRWDIFPRKLKLETTLTYIKNDAANGGYQDLLSNYYQLGAEFSIEYFFSPNISFKVIGGTDQRHMGYNTEKAQQVIADPDYGVMFFNSNESYNGLKYGAEINWIF
jgi:hypothetical protein